MSKWTDKLSKIASAKPGSSTPIVIPSSTTQAQSQTTTQSGVSSDLVSSLPSCCKTATVKPLVAAEIALHPEEDPSIVAASIVARNTYQEQKFSVFSYQSVRGTVAATKNLTQVSSRQMDVYVQPGKLLTDLSVIKMPAKFALNPVTFTFNSEGKIAGTGATEVTITPASIGDLPVLGYRLVVSRNDLLVGKSLLAVDSSVYKGSFDIANANNEATLSLLLAALDTTLDVTGSIKYDANTGLTSASFVGESATEALSAFISTTLTSDLDSVVITGANIYVKIYPIVLNAEVYNKVVSVIGKGAANSLPALFL